jgi:RNA polymerase sigma-70 factor, ECF subfamily
MDRPRPIPEIPVDATHASAIASVVSDHPDDSLDVAAARRGDQTAFARLYDRHAAVVLSVCRKLSVRGSHEEAEDALQETFIRAMRTLDRLDRPEGFRPWLYAIARFVCSERRRAAGRRGRHEEVAMTLAVAGSASLSHVETAERDEELKRLDHAMNALPDDERLALHLYYLETDPICAAASALNVSRSGYYKLLARARQRLSALLKEATVS